MNDKQHADWLMVSACFFMLVFCFLYEASRIAAALERLAAK